MSFVLAPRASKERMRRSSETLESAASIFAIRDWLEPILAARSDCESPPPTRRSRRLRLSANRISTSAASSSDSLRKSLTDPDRHPAFRGFPDFSCFTCLAPEYALAGMATISQAQLMTARSYRRHGSRMRHPDALSALQPPQQNAGVYPAGLRERWRLDLAVQPDKRLGFRTGRHDMSFLTWREECQRRWESKGAPARKLCECSIFPGSSS